LPTFNSTIVSEKTGLSHFVRLHLDLAIFSFFVIVSIFDFYILKH
jgi:hypothetical protein